MRKALVVGINDYPNSPLKGCVNDATAVAESLRAHADGSPNFAVKLVTSPSRVVDRAGLKGAISELFDGTPDSALLYFSGHGCVTATGGYVVTSDAKKYDEGVSMDEILALANKSRAKNKVILLDCCYAGNLGSPAVLTGESALLSQGLSVLTACGTAETALETNGQGVFTSLIIEALRGGAADLRGEVSPGALYAYVDRALGPWDQRPVFKTNVTSFTSLRKAHPPIAPATLRKITTYFPGPDSEFKLDPSYEFTHEPHDDAHVAILKDLQKMEGVGLVVPIGEEHMYFAAMHSKPCGLTAIGHQYWRLVKENRI